MLNHPTGDISSFRKKVEGWDGPGRDGRPGRVRGRVTVGLSKGTGVEVYCFMERSLFSCRCVHSGGESPLMGLVAYCWAGQETHGWRILSCPPVSGTTMSNQDSARCCSSSVGDSVSLITTAFVTSMSGCCCLASWIAMASA